MIDILNIDCESDDEADDSKNNLSGDGNFKKVLKSSKHSISTNARESLIKPNKLSRKSLKDKAISSEQTQDILAVDR